jgi:tRNA-specific 2-thiouridylase
MDIALPGNTSPKERKIMKVDSTQKTRVAVAMSGGVDSSVAAALLVAEGYDVIGIMLRLWSEPGSDGYNRCCTPDAMALARQVAAQLDIPFYPIDAQNVFYNQVVEPFMEGYTGGITPNPCLRCNRYIRWDFLLNHALAFGADAMATGHYARLNFDSERTKLLKAVDESKDQSYVLHVLKQEQISRALFPLGDYTKDEVRHLAREFNLPVAERHDSQDLCFLGDGNYRDFLARNSNQAIRTGDILTTLGEKLGEHRGLAMYTIGQRRGLGLSSTEPLYVLDKDMENNVLLVGAKDELNKNRLRAEKVNWMSISPPEKPLHAHVKIRYKSAEEPATIIASDQDTVEIQFDHSIKGITPGQAAVFYDAETCLGGGIIQ